MPTGPGAWLNLAAIAQNRIAWNRFWYHEVDAAAVPRIWLRVIVPWVQAQTKIGSGNPRDAQHAAYLLDADVFITADRRYAAGLELVRKWSPAPFADVNLIAAQGSTVKAIETRSHPPPGRGTD